MGEIDQPDENRAEKCAEELRREVRGHLVPCEFAHGGEAERYRGIDMRAADLAHRVNRHRHGHSPPSGDHHPAAILGFGTPEQARGHHTVAQ